MDHVKLLHLLLYTCQILLNLTLLLAVHVSSIVCPQSFEYLKKQHLYLTDSFENQICVGVVELLGLLQRFQLFDDRFEVTKQLFQSSSHSMKGIAVDTDLCLSRTELQ